MFCCWEGCCISSAKLLKHNPVILLVVVCSSLDTHDSAICINRLSFLLHNDPSSRNFMSPVSKVFDLLTLFLFLRRLLGIITKKDILRHMAQMANHDPESIMFNWTESKKSKRRVKRRFFCWRTLYPDRRVIWHIGKKNEDDLFYSKVASLLARLQKKLLSCVGSSAVNNLPLEGSVILWLWEHEIMVKSGTGLF